MRIVVFDFNSIIMIDYFTDNSLRRTTYNVSLVNLLTVLIFQPRVLADGGGVYLSDNFAGFVGYNLMCYTSIPVSASI